MEICHCNRLYLWYYLWSKCGHVIKWVTNDNITSKTIQLIACVPWCRGNFYIYCYVHKFSDISHLPLMLTFLLSITKHQLLWAHSWLPLSIEVYAFFKSMKSYLFSIPTSLKIMLLIQYISGFRIPKEKKYEETDRLAIFFSFFFFLYCVGIRVWW